MILPLPILAELPTPVLRVSDLRQWVYCPRVVWWTHVCPVGKVESFKMRQGLLKERRRQRLQRRRTLRAFQLEQGEASDNINLFSTRLGLAGRLDMLIKSGECRYPVEMKFTSGPARLNHRIQLAGYAMLLEEEFGVAVTHGYVVRLPDDTVDRVPIDEPLRELTRQTIGALRQMIRHERMPTAAPILAKCVDCEYRLFCGDVLP